MVELDTLGAEGHAARVELQALTGRSSVPNIFVGGASVGGYSELSALNDAGKLQTQLKAAKAL